MMVLNGADGSGSLYSWINSCPNRTTNDLSNLAVWDLDFQGTVASMCFRYFDRITMVAYNF